MERNIFPHSTPTDAPPLYGVDAQAINLWRIPLDVARSEVEWDFGASNFLWAYAASSDSVELEIKFNQQSSGALPIQKGMVIRGVRFARTFLTNQAQSGGFIDLMTVREGEGGLVSVENPAVSFTGVSITRPSVVDTVSDVSVNATSSGQVLAANADRFRAFINNLSGNTVRVGDSNVGATRGLPLEPGETVDFEGTEAIHVYNPGGVAADIAVMEVAL